MSPDTEGVTERRMNRNHQLLHKRLREALTVARSGETAIVIVPHAAFKQQVPAFLGQNLDPMDDHQARATADVLHFECTRGQVRIYPCDHITYDRRLKRLIDYPVTTKHFLHPEVEEAI